MPKETTPMYEVYALRYGTQTERPATENFLLHDAHDTPMAFDYYIWAIRGGGRTVVVDTGFSADAAARRNRTLLRSPAAALSRIGVDARAVTDVILTHMHYDHAGNLDAFPNACFHIQDSEMAYCTGRCMTHETLRRPFEATAVVSAIHHLYDGRMRFHDGDDEILPGVSVHLIGGHTAGLQAVRVPTARGHVVLASDSVHLWAHIRERRAAPIVLDVARMLEGHRIIEALADGPDHVIPGHDPAVRASFPAIHGDADIVRLHQPPIEAARRPLDPPPARRQA